MKIKPYKIKFNEKLKIKNAKKNLISTLSKINLNIKLDTDLYKYVDLFNSDLAKYFYTDKLTLFEIIDLLNNKDNSMLGRSFSGGLSLIEFSEKEYLTFPKKELSETLFNDKVFSSFVDKSIIDFNNVFSDLIKLVSQNLGHGINSIDLNRKFGYAYLSVLEECLKEYFLYLKSFQLYSELNIYERLYKYDELPAISEKVRHKEAELT